MKQLNGASTPVATASTLPIVAVTPSSRSSTWEKSGVPSASAAPVNWVLEKPPISDSRMFGQPTKRIGWSMPPKRSSTSSTSTRPKIARTTTRTAVSACALASTRTLPCSPAAICSAVMTCLSRVRSVAPPVTPMSRSSTCASWMPALTSPKNETPPSIPRSSSRSRSAAWAVKRAGSPLSCTPPEPLTRSKPARSASLISPNGPATASTVRAACTDVDSPSENGSAFSFTSSQPGCGSVGYTGAT